MMNYIKLTPFFLTLFLLTACQNIAVMTTPKKEATLLNTDLSRNAESQFWQTLHAGDYAGIRNAIRLQTAAYLENPNNPQLAAHLGFLHIWKITERQRLKDIPPTITNEIILSKRYFQESVLLAPYDARYLGFFGDSQLIEGQIFNNQREQVRGYFTLQRAIHAWPEFNYFTAGYIMSTLPANSTYFKEGLDWQWKTIDLCANTKINRQFPDFSPYMHLETQQGKERACWNSWIAPYNFEGFFLNMGDMLVKSGDWRTAKIIYHNATYANNYSAWPYRSLLENRIKDAKENVSRFQNNNNIEREKNIIFNSGYGCVMCHQK